MSEFSVAGSAVFAVSAGAASGVDVCSVSVGISAVSGVSFKTSESSIISVDSWTSSSCNFSSVEFSLLLSIKSSADFKDSSSAFLIMVTGE